MSAITTNHKKGYVHAESTPNYPEICDNVNRFWLQFYVTDICRNFLLEILKCIDEIAIGVFTMDKSDGSVGSDRNKMQFLRIITI